MTATPPEPPTGARGIEMPCQFTPTLGDIRALPITLEGVGEAWAVAVITASTSVVTFWTKDEWRAKLAQLTEQATGIETAPASALTLLKPPR